MGETGQDKSLRPGAPSPVPHVSSQEWSFRQIGPWHLPAKITLLSLPGTLGSKPNAHPWFTGLTWAGRCFLLSSALDILVPCWTCSSYSEHPSFSSTQHSLFLQPGTFHLPSLSPGKLLLIPQALAEMVPPLWSIPDHAQLRQPPGFSPSLEPPVKCSAFYCYCLVPLPAYRLGSEHVKAGLCFYSQRGPWKVTMLPSVRNFPWLNIGLKVNVLAGTFRPRLNLSQLLFSLPQ